jgi:hypothetical protein
MDNHAMCISQAEVLSQCKERFGVSRKPWVQIKARCVDVSFDDGCVFHTE